MPSDVKVHYGNPDAAVTLGGTLRSACGRVTQTPRNSTGYAHLVTCSWCLRLIADAAAARILGGESDG